MYRFLVALLLAAATAPAVGAIQAVLPCDRNIGVFGGPTVLAKGVRVPGSNDLATRLEVLFARACQSPVHFETFADEREGIIERAGEISAWISRNPRSIVFLHFPVADVESGASPDQLLRTYRSILDTCSMNKALCIIGGQQPVNAFSEELADRQLELEQRAAFSFGANYLPLYRYFASESSTRRLMLPLDSGDGRFVDDRGHDLLFRVYRRRLLELTGSNG